MEKNQHAILIPSSRIQWLSTTRKQMKKKARTGQINIYECYDDDSFCAKVRVGANKVCFQAD